MEPGTFSPLNYQPPDLAVWLKPNPRQNPLLRPDALMNDKILF